MPSLEMKSLMPQPPATLPSKNAPLAAPSAVGAAWIAQLEASPLFRNFQSAFSDLTGLPLSLRPADHWQLHLHGCANENGFCQRIAKHPATCATCTQQQLQLTAAAAHTATALRCPFGLVDIAVPVRHGATLLGHLFTGQFALRPSGPTQFRQAACRLQQLGVKTNLRALRHAFGQSVRLSARQQKALLILLNQFAEQLSQQAERLLFSAQHAEPPLIGKAREFLAQHLAEPITLGALARHLYVSRYYCCKQFHKHTGLRFTEYRARLRVERARVLLRDPHRRVGEVAFEVGFLSLPHFNRCFRRVTGMSPSQSRANGSPERFNGQRSTVPDAARA